MYNITMVPVNCTNHVPTSSSSVHNYWHTKHEQTVHWSIKEILILPHKDI
jgi:hypothetical protein